jgi:hypothetical protein
MQIINPDNKIEIDNARFGSNVDQVHIKTGGIRSASEIKRLKRIMVYWRARTKLIAMYRHAQNLQTANKTKHEVVLVR